MAISKELTGLVNEFCLDLFIVTSETWGVQNVIRTGPSLFSHRYVTNRNVHFLDNKTQRRFHGLLPTHLAYIRGEAKIKRGDEILELPEEKDALEIIECGWISPEERMQFALSNKIGQ